DLREGIDLGADDFHFVVGQPRAVDGEFEAVATHAMFGVPDRLHITTVVGGGCVAKQAVADDILHGHVFGVVEFQIGGIEPSAIFEERAAEGGMGRRRESGGGIGDIGVAGLSVFGEVAVAGEAMFVAGGAEELLAAVFDMAGGTVGGGF